MNVADVVVEELMARDVSWVATLNGHGLAPFLNACRHANMRIIDVRNEQSAGYMAEVAGRLTRSVGVCAVSGAVAHANALTGVLNAHFDGAPMLLITGIAPQAALGWGNFQDFNPGPMAAPYTARPTHVYRAPMEEILMTRPLRRATMSSRTCRVQFSTPVNVTISCSRISAVVSTNGTNSAGAAALFTRMSMGPNSAVACCTILRTAASSFTSAGTAHARDPASVNSSHAARADFS